MWRNIGGVIAGIIVASVSVGVLEALGHWIEPPPQDLMSPDVEKRQAAFALLQPLHFALVLVAWTIGVFLGSFVAAAICRGPRLVLAAIVGLMIWLGALANLVMIPSPLWFWIAGLTLIPMGCIAGAVLATKLWPEVPAAPQPYDMRVKNMAC